MLSIGILSHYAPNTLSKTLSSYKSLFEITDDIFAVLQYSDKQKEEEKVCEEFQIRYISLSDNGIMGSGFKAIYENAKYDYILFLENDFEIDKNINVDDFINNSIHFLNLIQI
jgi:GT2 family glycosyltransferase